MHNLVIIINGKPRVGKDTFAHIVFKLLSNEWVVNLSTVDPVRKIMDIFRIDVTKKTPEIRRAMSDCKEFLETFDVTTDYVVNMIESVVNKIEGNPVFIVHCREPQNIDKLKSRLTPQHYVVTVLLERNTENVQYADADNDSDNNVANYSYDYVLHNNGNLEDFEKTVATYLSRFFADKNRYYKLNK